jgi:hypothetical protein
MQFLYQLLPNGLWLLINLNSLHIENPFFYEPRKGPGKRLVARSGFRILDTAPEKEEFLPGFLRG